MQAIRLEYNSVRLDYDIGRFLPLDQMSPVTRAWGRFLYTTLHAVRWQELRNGYYMLYRERPREIRAAPLQDRAA